MIDNVNHPKHYEGSTSIECIEAMIITFGKHAVYDFCKCNAFKYVWRYKNKNGIEDLRKAEWYINKAKTLSDSWKNNEQLLELQKLINDKLQSYTTYELGGDKVGYDKNV